MATPMTQRRTLPVDAALWGQRVRAHDHTVLVSLLALGLRPDRAREIAQATWLRLIEQDAAGALPAVELPGLAIRQARFLALDAIRRDAAERARIAAALEIDPASDDAVERRLADRQELERVKEVLAGCSPRARRLFHLLYGRGMSAGEAAGELGISVQRARQLLCETRKKIRAALEEDRS
jgi:RNA polymerase sigma-70 factor (ECF subfamily)